MLIFALDCSDLQPERMCLQWAGPNRQGCTQQYMQENCRKTCAFCGPVTKPTPTTTQTQPTQPPSPGTSDYILSTYNTARHHVH